MTDRTDDEADVPERPEGTEPGGDRTDPHPAPTPLPPAEVVTSDPDVATSRTPTPGRGVVAPRTSDPAIAVPRARTGDPVGPRTITPARGVTPHRSATSDPAIAIPRTITPHRAATSDPAIPRTITPHRAATSDPAIPRTITPHRAATSDPVIPRTITPRRGSASDAAIAIPRTITPRRGSTSDPGIVIPRSPTSDPTIPRTITPPRGSVSDPAIALPRTTTPTPASRTPTPERGIAPGRAPSNPGEPIATPRTPTPPPASASRTPTDRLGTLATPREPAPATPRTATSDRTAPVLPRTTTSARIPPVAPRTTTDRIGTVASPRTTTGERPAPVPSRTVTDRIGTVGMPRPPTPGLGVATPSATTDPGSGRTVTNRNVVPRQITSPPVSGVPRSQDAAARASEAFEVVTPVHAQPSGVIDAIDATRERFIDRTAEDDAAAFDAPTAPLPMTPSQRERLQPDTAPAPRARISSVHPVTVRIGTDSETTVTPPDAEPEPAGGPEADTAVPRPVERESSSRTSSGEIQARPVRDRPRASSQSPVARSEPGIDRAATSSQGAARSEPGIDRAAASSQGVARSEPGIDRTATSSQGVARRAGTEPGHVEPQRRPTPPEAGEPARRTPTAPPAPLDPARTTAELPRRPIESLEAGEADVLDRVLRVATIVAVLGLGLAGLAQPASVLRGGIAWLGFLFFALAGWGTLAGRLARAPDADFGLRAAWGTCGYLAVAGPLVAAGVLTRPVILALLAVGIAGFAWREATAPVASWQRVRDGLVFIRSRPALGMLVFALVALACVRMLGAVAELDRNPWDDDIAYTPFVKRLLDAGNLIEPFSFRRLGAYGGQTALDALGAARGSLANVHLIDQGLCFGIALLAIVGYARERRTQALWLALVGLVLLALPNAAINSAAYWSGVVVFVALYRTIVREHWVLVGVIAAAACSLRQNFIVTAVAFVAIALVLRLFDLARMMPWREAWHGERRNILVTAVAGLATILPWWIAAGLSSHTFLYPVIDGTWNHELSLRPAVVTWADELGYFASCCVETAPIIIIPILALALVFASDRRRSRPLTAMFAASVLGFAFLVHGFVGSDPFHLWRYAFGFALALLAMFVLEISADADTERVRLVPLGRWIVLAALVLQIVVTRTALPKQYAQLFGNIREAAAVDRHGDPVARAERHRYAALQAAIPAGEALVVMLDDPAYLDFRRNPIANLDTPGLASPGAQLPAFRGAEPLRTYLLAQGYRYVAFVRSDRSRYNFRREFWLWRIFNDGELFEIISAYAIDMIDSLAELATTTTVLYDADGLVALDLGTPLHEASHRIALGDEPARRDGWTRELADHHGLHDAWSLTTRSDLRFEDGISGLVFVDGGVDDPQWYDVTHPHEPPKQGQATRPLQRRAHLRVRGSGDMRLVLRVAISLNMVWTHPRLDISLDGDLIASGVADDRGKYTIEAVVPRERLDDGWHDLYLVFSTFADPDKDARDIRGARLEGVEWAPP